MISKPIRLNHLQNTNENILNQIWDISVLQLIAFMKNFNTLKGHKDIKKINSNKWCSLIQLLSIVLYDVQI